MTRRRRRGVGFKWWKGATSAWSLASKDASGTTIYDLVGTNNGTSANTPVFVADQNGVSGQAMSFNGSSDYVDCGNASNLTTTSGGFSVSCWARLGSTTGDRRILHKGGQDNTNYDYALSFTASETIEWACSKTSGDMSGVDTDDTYNTIDTWYHIVGVYDGASTYTIYINGSSVATSSITYSSTNYSDLYLGEKNNGTQKFTGSISDIAIYSEAKSATWVAQQYARTK